MSEPTHDKLIAELTAARLGGTTIASPDFISDLQTAYSIQESVSKRLGGTPVGWKVGSTSLAAQRRLGTSEPGAGRLLSQHTYQSGSRIQISANHNVQIEIEFAFIFGKSLAPRPKPFCIAEIQQAIDAFLPGIELVGSRYTSGLTGSGREAVTADCGANIAFAYGSPVSYKPELNLADQTCRAFINHHQVAKGNGSNALDDPLNVLVWLANHLSRRGITLEAGAIVTTGTCTGLTDVKAGDHVAGDFGVLGRVDAMLTALG